MQPSDCYAMHLQDFPPKSPRSAPMCTFESDLADYFKAIALPGACGAELQQLLAAHDFSSARVALLPSVPGYHSGQGLRAWQGW